jgi:hypothetical protein
VTLTALKLDKKDFDKAKKIIDALRLKVMMAKESVTEGREKKVTKQMWKRMKEDDRVDALLSVFKDPDEAIEHWEKDWDKLPREAHANDMYIYK